MIGKKGLFAIFVIFLAYQLNKNKKITGETVSTKNGKVRGVVTLSRDGREFYEWLGIPYAEPPIGELRFATPQPVRNWKGVLDTSSYGAKCAQVDLISYEAVGVEDCLFLNIATPKNRFRDVKRRGKLLPVMFWLHGGYFAFGSANIYRPTYFMDEDVVIVTINYRLGAFGFLSTGDKHIRGNMGLKDQSLALKWVKENIANFGGDPEQITVFGESAGGASAHFQIISPMSKGLMARAISQSGTALSPWSLFPNPVGQAKAFADKLGCPSESSQVIVDCLRELDVKTLIDAQRHTVNPERKMESMFVPVVEGVNDKEAFIAEHPLKLYSSGKVAPVPWISGVNADEGVIFVVQMHRNETFRQRVGTNWDLVEEAVLFLQKEDKKDSQAIRMFYMGHENNFDPLEESEAMLKLASDRGFLVPVHKAVEIHSKIAPTFPYWYAQEGPGFGDLLLKFKGIYHPGIEMITSTVKEMWNEHILREPRQHLGVGHADEIVMLFYAPMLFNIPKENPNYEFSKKLIKAWVSFAKGDHPEFNSTRFPKVENTQDIKYLYIHDEPEVVSYPNPERLKFWLDLESRSNYGNNKKKLA